ncbi:16680_t:CDS:2 [Funneliformis mosseae]|uniref:Putative lipoate-protein ligase A n=1 Tax=Funneliformis mosseae TaxID=27381 RepID=A0A9N9N721_FUNMO|nr:16680_t:CDS:2 [Funneliformis mosseae]
MLIDTDLDRIKKYLKVDKQNLITKGVESVPSPVTNLRAYSSTVSHESFCEAVKDVFTNYYCNQFTNISERVNTTIVDVEFISKIPKVIEYCKEIKTWEWIYGQTPEFTLQLEKEFDWGYVKALFKSKNGFITAVTLTPLHLEYSNLFNALEDALEGRRYDEEEISNALNNARIHDVGSGSLIPISEVQRMINDLGKWIKEAL